MAAAPAPSGSGFVRSLVWPVLLGPIAHRNIGKALRQPRAAWPFVSPMSQPEKVRARRR